MSPLYARVRAFLTSWFGGFRYQTFFLTISAACGLAKEVCDWTGVQHDAQPFVIGLFGAAVAFAFILNPKSVAWVGDAKDTVHAVRTGDYDAVADLISDPLDESRDKDPQLELPIYNNSAPAAGIYANSADSASKGGE